MWSQTFNQKKPHSVFHSATSFIAIQLTFGILTKVPSKNIWQHEENTLREQKRQHNLSHIYNSLQCQSLFLHLFDYIHRHTALQVGQKKPATEV